MLTAPRPGPARRVDLLASIGGISDKSLHQSLERLQDRRGDAAVYALTEVGTSLATGPLLDLARWAEQHRLSVRVDG